MNAAPWQEGALLSEPTPNGGGATVLHLNNERRDVNKSVTRLDSSTDRAAGSVVGSTPYLRVIGASSVVASHL